MKRIRNSKVLLAGSVFLTTLIVYLSSLQNDFVNWDDNLYVFDNPFIRSFDAVLFRRAFFDFHVSNWHPLTWISHALDYALWGLNPLGHHLTNNILHAVNTFVVVLLIIRLLEAFAKETISKSPSPSPSPLKGEGTVIISRPVRLGGGEGHMVSPPAQGEGSIVSPPLRGGDEGEGEEGGKPFRQTPPLEKGDRGGFSDKRTLIAAATTGLLFGLHPVHVESVAWVAERKDLLCALFFLLSIMMYVGYVTPPILPLDKGRREEGLGGTTGRGQRYLLSLIFFLLALMSKPMAVSLPLVLLILDWYPFERIRSFGTFRTALVEKLPFIILSFMSSIVTIAAQKAGGAMELMESVPLASRLLVAAKSLIAYLWKMIVPLNLVPFYPYPKEISFFSLEYLASVALLLCITAACVSLARKQKMWLAAWAYYVMTLLPVLGIVQVGNQAMADRYTYLPSFGPFLIMGFGAAWVWGKVKAPERWGPGVKFLGPALIVLVFVPMGYLTVKQIDVWKNSIVLWSYVIEKEPENAPRAYTNLGSTLLARGRFDEALENFDKAIALDPNDYLAYSNRGAVFEKMGRFDEALENFDMAITRNPKVVIAYFNRGATFAKMGRFDKALENFDRAIALDPGDYLAYSNRSAVYEKIGRFDKAFEDLDMTIALNPSYYEAYARKGVLYGQAGSFDKAIEFLGKSVAMNPDFAFAYVNRGVAYGIIGQHGRALEDFNRAIALDQKFAEAYLKRGDLHLRTGNKESALSDFRKACDLGNRDGCNVLQGLSKTEGP